MPVLPAVGTRGVQAKEGHAATRFFDVDAVVDAVEGHREVMTDDRFELNHRTPPHRVSDSSRIRFIMRCSARAFCIATRLSPSSTNSGTRISMAKKSWNSGGGLALRNLRHTDTGARKPNGV